LNAEKTGVRSRAIRPISDDFFGFFGAQKGCENPKKVPARGIFSLFKNIPLSGSANRSKINKRSTMRPPTPALPPVRRLT
jgi:hypothetical protein